MHASEPSALALHHSLDVGRQEHHHRASYLDHAGASQALTTHSAAHASSMAAASNEDEAGVAAPDASHLQRAVGNGKNHAEQHSEEDDDEEEDADEEPKLKYTRLTGSLAPVYRNGDATSTFMVAGDKMVWRMPPGSELSPVAEHMLSSR